MTLAAQIAWRYLFAGRKRFAAFITWISVAGLALGVIVLTVVVSVMNGFDQELRSRLLGTIPHILIDTPVANSSDAKVASLRDDPRVRQSLRFFSGAGMVTQNGVVNPISLYAVDDHGVNVLTQPGQMFQGSGIAMLTTSTLAPPSDGAKASARTNRIVLGAPLARYLRLFPGDSVALVLSIPTATGIKPRLFRFELAGTFEIGAELDSSLAVVHLSAFSDAQWREFGQLGWRLDMHQPMGAAAFARDARTQHPELGVTSWAETYGEFFRAVALEKALMFLVLLMVVAVASFNIVSGQLMVVAEKGSDIAILRTMGAKASLIRRVFVLQGVFIASIGILGGLVIGVVAAANIAKLVQWLASVSSYRLLEGTYFAALPSVVSPWDLLLIAVMAWSLCVLAAWLPARRAANLNPIQALHLG